MIEEAIDKIITMTPGKYVLDAFGRQVWDKNGATLPDPTWPTLGLVSLTALEEYIKEAHPPVLAPPGDHHDQARSEGYRRLLRLRRL